MKHVKKSMFISTVLMVVMLVAALSTATFAWYTSNNTASSNAVQVGAAQATSANIGIGFYKGATGSTITFQNLVNSSTNLGTMNPVIPTKYFDESLKTPQNIAAAYATSIVPPTSDLIVAGGVGGADYKRIVNLTSGLEDENGSDQVSEIIAASSITHSWDDDIITNLTGLGTKYEHVYTIQNYAYNNSITTASAAASIPNIGDKITISEDVYTIRTTDPQATCYKVTMVAVIKETGADDEAAMAKQQDESAADHQSRLKTTGITISLANRLSGNTFTPNENTYVVFYNVYASCAYTIADVTTFDSTAKSVGYAAAAAETLNSGDILESTVKSTTAYHINEVKYNTTDAAYMNFAYLAQIYAGSDYDNGTLTNKTGENNTGNLTWTNFTFNKAAIDADGFFQSNGVAASIGTHYSQASDEYTGDADVSVVTGKNTAGNASETWYVTNNGSTAINLSVALNVTGDNASLLRVALFKNGQYVGTLSGNPNQETTYGKILKGSKASSMPTYKATNTYDLGSLAAGNLNAAEFQIVAWFDGTLLNDAAAGKNCAFTLVFTAA